MKKVLVVGLLLSLVLLGCGHMAKESEFWEHDTMYKNWDHMKFSLWGYKNPTEENAQKFKEQGWWGIKVKVPHVPAE
jgi:hypothetical protein